MPSANEPSDWARVWLSPERWQRYLSHCDGNAEKALALYEWNLKLSGAVMHDVAHIEVAIRNVYDQSIVRHWRGDSLWLFDASSPVNAPLMRSRRGRRLGLNARHRASIAEAM